MIAGISALHCRRLNGSGESSLDIPLALSSAMLSDGAWKLAESGHESELFDEYTLSEQGDAHDFSVEQHIGVTNRDGVLRSFTRRCGSVVSGLTLRIESGGRVTGLWLGCSSVPGL